LLTWCGPVGELHLASFEPQHMSISKQDVSPTVSMVICSLCCGHISFL